MYWNVVVEQLKMHPVGNIFNLPLHQKYLLSVTRTSTEVDLNTWGWTRCVNPRITDNSFRGYLVIPFHHTCEHIVQGSHDVYTTCKAVSSLAVMGKYFLVNSTCQPHILMFHFFWFCLDPPEAVSYSRFIGVSSLLFHSCSFFFSYLISYVYCALFNSG